MQEGTHNMGAQHMDHRIEFVGDDDLPEEQDWALIRTQTLVLFAFKRSRLTPEVLESAWCAFRRLAQDVPLALVG